MKLSKEEKVLLITQISDILNGAGENGKISLGEVHAEFLGLKTENGMALIKEAKASLEKIVALNK